MNDVLHRAEEAVVNIFHHHPETPTEQPKEPEVSTQPTPNPSSKQQLTEEILAGLLTATTVLVNAGLSVGHLGNTNFLPLIEGALAGILSRFEPTPATQQNQQPS